MTRKTYSIFSRVAMAALIAGTLASQAEAHDFAFSLEAAAEAEAQGPSRRLIEQVQQFEGFRAVAYDDLNPFGPVNAPVEGTLTIGWGCTRNVVRGAVVTEAEAEQCLIEDLNTALAAVDRLIEVPLADHERDALASFVFNVGEGALEGSTLRRRLNEDDREAAAGEFDRWVYSSGRRLAGLVSRRAEERAWFEGEGEAAGEGEPEAQPLPVEPPADLASAPEAIRLPEQVVAEMRRAWALSHYDSVGDRVREYAGVLVLDEGGEIVARHVEPGERSTANPNRTAAEAAGETIVGTFHTHPYTRAEGHANVAHSAGDFIYALFFGDATLVEAGERQFLLLPTAKAEAIPYEGWDAYWSAVGARLDAELAKGASLGEASVTVGAQLAAERAIAFYQGENGRLERVRPF